MDRYLSSILFTVKYSNDELLTLPSHELRLAHDAGLKEKWLQDAIAKNPELVLSPCRAVGLIEEDERWKFWGREVHVDDAGDIDVLLISENGRVGIVETKLAYNPEARRAVLAQVLDYAVHLPSTHLDLETIPTEDDGRPFVDQETVKDKLQEADYLLIIAGDRLDSRAVKLSEALLGKHLIRGWDLALVEVAMYQERIQPERREYILVPHLRGVLVAQQRQVVRVLVEGDRTQVTVEPTAPVAMPQTEWNEEQFFDAAEHATAPLRDFAHELRLLRQNYPEVQFEFGRSKFGSIILKRGGSNIIEFYLGFGGYIRFRPKDDNGKDNFVEALGEQSGQYYREQLNSLFPRSMEMGYPLAKFDRDHAEKVLPVLEEALRKAVSGQPHQQSTQPS